MRKRAQSPPSACVPSITEATRSRDPLTSSSKPQPFTLKAGALFGITGLGLYFYFQGEKKKVAERKAAETAHVKVGKPKIGGPFELTTQDGAKFGDKDLLGRWSLVYVSLSLRGESD